jgi:hypothetical protein
MDSINCNYPVSQPNGVGNYRWMCIRAGGLSAFGNENTHIATNPVGPRPPAIKMYGDIDLCGNQLLGFASPPGSGVTIGTNQGGGAGQVYINVDPSNTINFRTIEGADGITVSQDVPTVGRILISGAGLGDGEANTGENVGINAGKTGTQPATGDGAATGSSCYFYQDTVSEKLQFKSMQAGPNIILSNTNTETITIEATTGGGGAINDGLNVGTEGVGIFNGVDGDKLEFRKIIGLPVNPPNGTGLASISATPNIANETIELEVNENALLLNNLAGTVAVAKGGTGIGGTGPTFGYKGCSNLLVGQDVPTAGDPMPLLRIELDKPAGPTLTDDENSTPCPYKVGSRWMDTTNEKEYVCVNATGGAANWLETTIQGGGSGGDGCFDAIVDGVPGGTGPRYETLALAMGVSGVRTICVMSGISGPAGTFTDSGDYQITLMAESLVTSPINCIPAPNSTLKLFGPGSIAANQIVGGTGCTDLHCEGVRFVTEVLRIGNACPAEFRHCRFLKLTTQDAINRVKIENCRCDSTITISENHLVHVTGCILAGDLELTGAGIRTNSIIANNRITDLLISSGNLTGCVISGNVISGISTILARLLFTTVDNNHMATVNLGGDWDFVTFNGNNASGNITHVGITDTMTWTGNSFANIFFTGTKPSNSTFTGNRGTMDSGSNTDAGNVVTGNIGGLGLWNPSELGFNR